MSIFSLGFLAALAVGIGAMTDAFERGDRDEASRLGMLAGPNTVEEALASPRRSTQLAAVLAAPHVEARPELLPALSTLAGSPDRRVAIPAAYAARTIARELARDQLPDDIDTDDVSTWRALFDSLAKNGDRFIEVRVIALDTVASLTTVVDPSALGFDLAAALDDADPAFRAAAIAVVPRPTPAAARAPLAHTVKNDADRAVALAAAQVLCGDDRSPALPLLGSQGLDRIKALVAKKPARTVRDATNCLRR